MTYTTLTVGSTKHRCLVVDKPRTIDFLGESLRVYATPELVRDIELVCLDFLGTHAGAGESSVGTAVNIKHTGATLLGMQVEISATVTHIDRRSVTFDVSAHDGVEEICSGTHSRFIVDVERLRAAVEAKALKTRA
jgi:fluoroacetyl-CoA thioesterase